MPGPTVNVNITASVSKLRANLASASSLIRDWSLLATGLGSGVTTAFKNIASTGIAAAKAGIIGLAGAFIATTKVTADFEEEINRTFAIIRRGAGASAEDLNALRNEALRLGKDTLISATQSAKGMQLLARAGFDTQQVMQTLQPSINLAVAGNISMEQSTQGVVETLKQFGLEAKEAGRVTDVLAAASVKSNTNILELRTALSFVGPVAKAAGLSLEETVAAIAATSDAGVKGSRSGTGLRQAFSKMLSPTGRAAKIFKEYGINLKQSNGELKPMARLLSELQRASLDAGETLDAFGRRAGPAMFSLLNGMRSKVPDFIKDLKDSEGAADDLAQTFRVTLTGRIKDLLSSLGLVSIALNENFQKPLAKATFAVRNFINDIIDIGKANGLFKAFAKGVIDSLSPMTELFVSLANKFKDFVTNLTSEDVAGFFEEVKMQVQGVVDALTNAENINIFINTAKGLVTIFAAIGKSVVFMVSVFKSLPPILQENLGPLALISATILQVVGGITNVVILVIALRALILSLAGGAAIWGGIVAAAAIAMKAILVAALLIGAAIAGWKLGSMIGELEFFEVLSTNLLTTWRLLLATIKAAGIAIKTTATGKAFKGDFKELDAANAELKLAKDAHLQSSIQVGKNRAARKEKQEADSSEDKKSSNPISKILTDVKETMGAGELETATQETEGKLVQMTSEMKQLLAATKGTVGMVGDQLAINGRIIQDVKAELKELGIQVGKNKLNRTDKSNISVHK
jgi:TP901 family phage tail tape measure protein